jgi:hypothetical protein
VIPYQFLEQPMKLLVDVAKVLLGLHYRSLCELLVFLIGGIREQVKTIEETNCPLSFGKRRLLRVNTVMK